MTYMPITDTIFFYIAVATMFFAGSILAMVLLFGLSMGKTVKNSKGMIGLVLMSATLPIVVLGLQRTTSFRAQAGGVSLKNLEVVNLDEGSYLVNYVTSESVISYLQIRLSDGEVIPVLPTYTLEKRVDHSVILSREVQRMGDVTIIAGSTEIKLENEK